MRTRRRNVAAWLAAGALLALCNSAAAIPIHVTAGGVFHEPESLVTDGTQWSLDLVYESSVPDSQPNLATEGWYDAYLSLELSIGDQLYSLADFDASRSHIRIFNDRVSSGGVFYRDVVSFDGGIAGTTLNFGLVSAFGYAQPGGGPFSSDALIADPALLSLLFNNEQDPAWEATDFVFFDLQPGQTRTGVFADGDIDRFSASALTTTSVPEPGPWSLLSIGLLLVVGLRLTRRGPAR